MTSATNMVFMSQPRPTLRVTEWDMARRLLPRTLSLPLHTWSATSAMCSETSTILRSSYGRSAMRRVWARTLRRHTSGSRTKTLRALASMSRLLSASSPTSSARCITAIRAARTTARTRQERIGRQATRLSSTSRSSSANMLMQWATLRVDSRSTGI